MLGFALALVSCIYTYIQLSKVMDRLLRDRDAALEANSTFSGMPQSFIDWTWHTWLPANLHRYEKQRHE